ncbi:class II aldolase/adducin family protein [Pseudonocardia oroxyli]|uniref:Ribulose-5-phosphate 4-epimerase/Fuculose-1-phosphate aldolase n=1 Tax=Pseudonocardia oroxyli TaxID=366584 RepID=A0A1G8DWX9_PSEOR|nr:class II aldolase/adducin family protein [Pseudonocardia oroxyli]SDH62232.1 Ribulose-5-phosphate 4-epimerase/Fuculose-1-phosphate aldolase [Pseudonocardia oroxyli]
MATTDNRISIYQPSQEGLKFPVPPVFDRVEDERLHRKQRLAAACRMFADFGYSYGIAGHLTVRDPEHPELYWTNPFAVHFGQVRVSDLILVDHDGIVIEGRHAANRAGFVIHSAIHKHNPEIIASCHAHTVHGAAWAAMGRPLDPISQDVAIFLDDHVVIREEAGAIVVDDDAGDSVGAAFGDNKAAIHQNHGLFTAGRHSIDEAAWWFAALDHACRVQLLTENARTEPVHISHDAALHTAKHAGTPFMGWLQFQPIYDRLVAQQPGLLD